MNELKPIRNRADYDRAVVLLSELIDRNPAADSPDEIKLQILTALIEDYEKSTLPDYQVDPIEAIKLRVEQLGLRNRDLATYLGSRSRVSEILSGKRLLTVSMIKNLEEGLGIPASILIGSSTEKRDKRWAASTIKIMALRGYFGKDNTKLEPKKILELGLLRNIFNSPPLAASTLLRQSSYRDISNVDQYHMKAWSNMVIGSAISIIEKEAIPKYNRAAVNEDVLSNLFKLSTKPKGPVEAIKSLKAYGIVVIIEPHLPTTKLDGATFLLTDNPVIGLTLRYDRLDNFWFTLAHELSHIYLHYNLVYSAFYDQLFIAGEDLTDIENQADKLAGELLIPSEVWKLSPLRYGSTPTLVKLFAQQIGVHESVVAGRIRHDANDWSTHSDMVIGETVRKFFGDKIW